jgi:hypothetical protein
MKHMIRLLAVSAALVYAPFAFSSDVPSAVRKSVDTHAGGGKIVRWQRAGANYQAIINKNGQETGVELDASDRVMGTAICPCLRGSWVTADTHPAEKKTNSSAPRRRQ